MELILMRKEMKKKKKIGENVAITPNSYSPSAESRIWLSRGEQSKHVTY